MAEPVTLEYFAKQMESLLAELQATRDGVREILEIMQRCISKSEELRAVMQEGLCLLQEYNRGLFE